MIKSLDFSKTNGLLPVIVQDYNTSAVLMLGYMNEEALEKTMEDKKVTFWSRSKKRLWQKGETSGNYLKFVSMEKDCDSDSLLIQAIPEGPTCHTGSYSCFNVQPNKLSILRELEELISQRAEEMPENSYTTKLLKGNIDLVAQKVGEEAVETVVAGLSQDVENLHEESADLIYHLLVLLKKRNTNFDSVLEVLAKRRG
ncbi:MAG: bifunctional phosphoribosyl-AMP cyclohydrolase/phosphoribosyl-ATP diphosphatase HisIE [Candidatus Marinimicrobia bacterium]|nr:bifunctional phosphoribosyl-AMP cyclohydrolase/phosphoribosyl-ATP diphosphatase HisIE [Candidatus Neomarinimicrobiota bacterium]